MRDLQRAKSFLLAAVLLGGLVFCLFNGWAVYGIFASLFALVPLCGPFVALQLALCKYCRSRLLQAALALLSALGFFGGIAWMVEADSIAALAGFLVVIPSLLGLMGSGLGWMIWNLTQNRKN